MADQVEVSDGGVEGTVGVVDVIGRIIGVGLEGCELIL